MSHRKPPAAYRSAEAPIGTAIVSVGFTADAVVLEVPLLAISSLNEALVRLPDEDRWVPASWWAPGT